MGASGSKGVAPQSVGKREVRARINALRKGKRYDMLASNSAYARAGRADIARGLKARAAAQLWAARRQKLINAGSRIASATRKGAAAAARAAGAGAAAVGKGVGAAGSFLGKGARAAYNAAAAKTRNAYRGLRALSLKRRAKNFFSGKVKLTNADRERAKELGLDANGTKFRNLLKRNTVPTRPGSVANEQGRVARNALDREGGLGRKVASLTRKAKEGLVAAAKAAGHGAVAAKNAVTKKAGNLYAYGRNMLKYGRRRSEIERLESAKGRAKGAQNKAFSAIQRARNANAAAKVAAAARDKQLKAVKAGLTAAADKMGAAATAAGRGAAGAAATAAGAALAGIRAVTQKARNIGGSAVMSGLRGIGAAASTLKAKLSSNSAHKTGNAAKKSLFGRQNNGAPKPSALRAASAKLRGAASAVGSAIRAAPGKAASALKAAALGTASALVAAGKAVGSGASTAAASARRAGSSLGNAVANQFAGLRAGASAFKTARRATINTRRRNRASAKAPEYTGLLPVVSEEGTVSARSRLNPNAPAFVSASNRGAYNI